MLVNALTPGMRVLARRQLGAGFGTVVQVGPGPDVYVAWDDQPATIRPECWHASGLVPLARTDARGVAGHLPE